MRWGSLVVCLLVFLHDATPASPYRLPSPPEKHVLDESDWLELNQQVKLETYLAKRANDWGVHVFGVILEKVPPQGGESYVKLLGNHWNKGKVWGVVLHVPGEKGSPWFASGGENLDVIAKPGELKQAMNKVMLLSHREDDERNQFRMGCWELVNELCFFQMENDNLSDVRSEKVEENLAAKFFKKMKQKILLILSGLALLFSLLLMIFLIRKMKSRRTVFEFPETKARKRLQAPWSGGGNVLLRYKEIGSDGKVKCD